LCDITHSPIRRKKQWDELAVRLDKPFRLYHLNEMPDDVSSVIANVGSPAVLAHTPGGLVPLLDPAALESLDGSVTRFDSALVRAVDALTV
jgi:hypothetical protein